MPKDKKLPDEPQGWDGKGNFDKKAEKSKKPGSEKKGRKELDLKKDMKDKGLRLRARDIYDILRKGFGKDVIFKDKVEYRLYWIFLRTWIYDEFSDYESPWKSDWFDYIEDLMREHAASKDGKSLKKLAKKILDKFKERRKTLRDRFRELEKELREEEDLDEEDEKDMRRKMRRINGEFAYLGGVIKELERICEELEKREKKDKKKEKK